MKYNTFAFSKEKCKEYNKNQMNVKGNMFYCPKCDKFLFYLFQIKHSINNHNMIFIKDMIQYIKYIQIYIVFIR